MTPTPRLSNNNQQQQQQQQQLNEHNPSPPRMTPPRLLYPQSPSLDQTKHNRKAPRIMMNKITMVALVTGALSLSAIMSFHPSSHYVQHFRNSNRYQHHPDELLATDATPWEIRTRERRKRTRPPQALEVEATMKPYQVMFPIQVDRNNKNSTLAPTSYKTDPKPPPGIVCGNTPAGEHNPDSYADILTADSRVVITNIFSSIGMHLALQLSQDCGVSAIMGIDPMLPNTRRHRTQAMERYALLKRRIPGLQRLMVPATGVLSNVPGEQVRLEAFRPTHIVHLVPDYDSHQPVTEVYPHRDRRLAMEQLLNFMRTYKEISPHFLYAGSNLWNEHLLASTYDALYNQQESLVGMELPRRIYGPWGDDTSWAWKKAQDVVTFKAKNATLNETMLPHVGKHDTFAYVEDVVSAVLTSMQLSRTTVLTLTSDTKKASLEDALLYLTSSSAAKKKPKTKNPKAHFQDLIQWMPVTGPVGGMQKLLSWHYTHATHPYGTVKQRKLPPYVVQNYHYQFPCASECSVHGSCRPSVFDGRVKEASKSLTKGCKTVLYMANFSTAVSNLPPSVSQPQIIDERICQLAFISEMSILMQQQNNKTREERSEYKGWQLIPVSTVRMTEAEYMLPKLSPGLLFDRSVSKAMYVEMKTSLLLPHKGDNLLDIRNSIDEPSKPAREKLGFRSGTFVEEMIMIPRTPAKIVMMFGQEDSYLNHNEEAKTLKLFEKVEYLWNHRPDDGRKKQGGVVNTTNNNRQLLHQHQVRFYEHAAHLIKNNERRSMDDLRSPDYGHEIPFWWWHSSFLVHELRQEESRLLRCEWYDEQVFWQSRGMEDLSLAYVLAKRRMLGQHGEKASEGSWMPLRTPAADPLEEGEIFLSPAGNHLFARVLEKPLDLLTSLSKTKEEQITSD